MEENTVETPEVQESKSLHQQLLEAGVHFGHLKKKWNPKMLPYIFAEKNGIHIIDLQKTIEGLEETAAAMKQIAKSGKKIMFVATKKQAKEIVAEAAQKVGMPYVTDRWLGGMLTNFNTIRRSVKKMQTIDKMLLDGSMEAVTKKERLTLTRSRDKMDKVLGRYLSDEPHAGRRVYGRHYARAHCTGRSQAPGHYHLCYGGYQLGSFYR